MKKLLFFLLFSSLGSPVFASNCYSLMGKDAGRTTSSKDNLNGTIACDTQTQCRIKLSFVIGYNPVNPNDPNSPMSSNIYSSVYTGADCSSGDKSPDGKPSVDPDKQNYCYSQEYENKVITASEACDKKGGHLTAHCDPDTQKTNFTCNGGSDKPDDGGNPDPNTVDHLLRAYDSDFKWSDACYLHETGGRITSNLNCFSQIADLQKATTHALANANQLIVKNAVDKLTLEANQHVSTLNTGLGNIEYQAEHISTNTGALIAPVRDIDQILKGMSDSDIKRNEDLDKILANSNTTQKYMDGFDNYLSQTMFSTRGIQSLTSKAVENLDAIYNQNDGLYSILSDINNNVSELSNHGLTAKISPKSIQTGVVNALKAYDEIQQEQGANMSTGFIKGFTGETDSYLKKYDDAFNSTNNPLAGKTFSNPIENVFVGSNTCEPITITLFGHSAEMVDHCRVMGVLNKFLVLIMWVWCGIAIYNDAARIYLAVTTD